MWFYILMTIAGAAGIAAGIILAIRKKQKLWHLLTAFSAVVMAIGIFLCAATLILVFRDDTPPTGEKDDDTYEIVGSDWRTYRAYSNDYKLSDKLTVCFSYYDNKKGEGVYDSSDGTRIGSLEYDGHTTATDTDEYVIADKNGDGANDIGVKMSDGSTLWFVYNADGVWPDTTGGKFEFFSVENGETVK